MKKKNLILTLAGILVASPVFADTNEADNTGINKRDANSQTLTPADQARGSDRDVELTRKIRQMIVKDESLSMNADNVKIITLNGVTTLRGPVGSTAEKTKVERLAAKVVGAKAVRNELEVKAQ